MSAHWRDRLTRRAFGGRWAGRALLLLALLAGVADTAAAQCPGPGFVCADEYVMPLAVACALARMAVLGLALWAGARAAIDAVGGEAAAWGKAMLTLVAVVMIYNPLWVPNRVFGLNIPVLPTQFCQAGINLCPASSFTPPRLP